MWGNLVSIVMLVVMLSINAYAQQPYSGQWDLTELSLQELMDVEITTLGRRQQKLTDTAAAVFVITQEDIRRSGATCIPELLRMVPGFHVARMASDRWAIASRGFNGSFSNKLLVLMDGRSVYNAAYAGVYWNVQDLVLDDIARIEVIRGPGASLWGSNAVNGIVNIVTKTARERQGPLVSVTTGTEERFAGAVRYGGALGQSAHYTAYTKRADRDESVTSLGEDTGDAWNVSTTGGRLDWSVTDRDALTIQGDYYNGTSRQSVISLLAFSLTREVEVLREDYSGYNVLSRWQHTFSPQSEFILQTYFSRVDSKSIHHGQQEDTFDLDLQHRFGLGKRQEMMWGLGYRNVESFLKASEAAVLFDPEQKKESLFSLFAQDDFALLPDKLSLILGVKLEKNDNTGWETQPNARLLFSPLKAHTFWAAVSKAVRTPTRYERDMYAVQPLDDPDYPNTYLSIHGSKDLKSEEILAYEAGYRYHPGDTFGLDLALFVNHYDKIKNWYWDVDEIYLEDGRYMLPVETANGVNGETYGGELALDWRPYTWWTLQGVYSLLKMDLREDNLPEPFIAHITEGQAPEQQYSLRSGMDLGHSLELDLWLRYVDNLAAETQTLPDYWALDARIGWRWRNVYFDLVGQNLLSESHPEFTSDIMGILPAEIERGVYLRCTWRP